MNKEVLEYINNIPLKYKGDYVKIFNIFKENLDKNIECIIQYGMPTFIIQNQYIQVVTMLVMSPLVL